MSFRELIVNQELAGAQADIAKYSPSGPLPVLLCNEFAVWESPAIREYVSQVLDHHAVQAWMDQVAHAAIGERGAAKLG